MRRFIVCVLLPIQLTACLEWRVQRATPQQLLELEPQTEKVRVTLSGTSWVVLQHPAISGDSLFGVVEEGEYLGRPLRRGVRTAIPLDRVVRVAVLRKYFGAFPFYGIVDVERLSQNTYPPVAPDDVTVFTSLGPLCADTIRYEEIAKIFTNASEFVGDQAHLRRATEEAANLGANGIILQATTTSWWDILVFDWRDQTFTAIRWAVIPPEVRQPAL